MILPFVFMAMLTVRAVLGADQSGRAGLGGQLQTPEKVRLNRDVKA